MKDRRLLALPVLVFALSCGRDQPMGPRVPTGPSEVILDGSHANGNKDFFFLPPLVPLALGNPDFELGEFNNALRLNLRVEICVLNVTTGLPTELNVCVGDPIKTWGPGSPEFVKLVKLPRRQFGWWTLFGLPPDGFYYVLWNTRLQNLNASKFYRIKVLIDGSTVPLGYADLDPMPNLREWRFARTGQVIQLVNGLLLPIPFRVENGAESFAFCETGTECVAATVHNVNPDESGKTIVRYEEGEVPLAGIRLTDEWAPEGVQSAVFIITRVNTGLNNVERGTQTAQCHANMDLQQFDACFNYRTVPDLGGARFRAQVIAAVCFVLHDTPDDPEHPDHDPRKKWVQLWSSEPGVVGDVPKPLVSFDEGEILTNEDGHNCETQEVGSNSSNPLIRLASTGWAKLTSGVGRVFGVKTAYAIDFGLGGILDDLSNIGPALTAEIREGSSTPTTVIPGATITSSVRIVGTKTHDGTPLGEVVPLGKTQGIPGLPVTFTLWSDGETPTQVAFGSEGAPMTLIGTTDGSGFASVVWTPSSTPADYTLRAAGQAKGGPVEYSATVTTALSGLVDFGTPDIGESSRQVINPYTDAATGIIFTADGGIVGISRNQGGGTSVCVLPEDGNQKLGTAPVASTSIGLSNFPIRATFPTTVPAGTAVSVDVQTGTPSTVGEHFVELRFLNAAGAQVGNITQPAIGPDVRCEGAPGAPRMKFVLSTTVAQAFKYLIVLGPGNAVFLIDNLQIGTP